MFRFLFQAAFLCVVSPLCRHSTCPTTTTTSSYSTTATAAAPPTRILSRYLEKGAPGHRVRGIGWSEGGREVRGGGGGRKRLSGPFISGSVPTTALLLLLLLPIVEPWGPGEAAPCLAAMQPLYHSNLLIVGAQLAHGGFLLEPPNIN